MTKYISAESAKLKTAVEISDVEKVVYCKDCRNFIKYSSGNICEEYGGYVKENDFCSRCPELRREDGF